MARRRRETPEHADGRWASRIVGHGTEDPTQLLAHPLNFRIHTALQSQLVEENLDRLGWIDEVTVNRATGRVINGHLRVVLAMRREERVPVRYVELSEAEEQLALATFDPLSALAEIDAALLDQLQANIVEALPDEAERLRLLDMAMRPENYPATDEAEISDNYSRKIESPVYRVTGECPPVAALCDRSKTEQLLAEIERTELPEEVAAFLRVAAERHTVFKFRNIAEFYAHADAATQDLMERSALVIIDFDDAIENGFVAFAREMMEEAEATRARQPDA